MKKNQPRFKKMAAKATAQPQKNEGLIIPKRILYAVIIPLGALLVLGVFLLVGLAIGRATAIDKQLSQPTPTPEIVYVTPEPTPTPTPTPSPSPSPTPSPSPAPEDTEETESNYFGRLGGTMNGGASYIGRITFVGGDAANKLNSYYDSITDDNVWYAASNHGAILEQLEVDINGKEYLLPEAVALAKPDIMLFCFCGINFGSRSWEADRFVDEYKELILELKKNASSGTAFVIMGLFPITDEYEASDTHYNQTNDRIAEINRGLEIFAYNNACYFLDVNGVLRGDDGSLKDEYWADSTNILNREGYRVVYNYIETHQVLH